MSDNILDTPDGDDKGERHQSIKDLRAFHKSLYQDSRILLDEGKTKAEIFSQKLDAHGRRYEKVMSRIIGFSISTEKEEEHANWFKALIALQIICLLGSLATTYFTYLEMGYSTGLMISTLIIFIIEGIILKRLLAKKLQILPSILIIEIVKIPGLLSDIQSGLFGNWIYLILVTTIALGLLAFLLKKKLFPSFGFSGPKRNTGGEYSF